jgi:murein DD-endopeptidase MepM/ murein hydrolase activator NlpD
VKKSFLLLFLAFVNFTFSQGDLNTYPKDYFRSPLDIPIVLSGTFGELRSNHFHSGMDFKTQQKEGLNVFAIGDGYVSRIKIAHWGFGKAIYVKHPNGFTSVYAHLKKFNEEIEAYIKKRQYEKESYEIQLFPKAGELVLKKGEIVAFSGNTGSSGGPHLHFEIRDSNTEKPINPLYFGIEVADSKKPIINTLIAYPLAEKSHINQIQIPTKIGFKKLANGTFLANKIKAFGKIGFGINTWDQQDGAYNKNGIYSLELLVNGKKMYHFKTSTFAFNETKYINLTIDYERYKKLSQRIHKCYVAPKNKLSILKKSKDGILNIKDSLNYNVEIIVKDFSGNTQKLNIPVIGSNDSIKVKKKTIKTNFWINHTKYNKITKSGYTVAFPKNTFYKDFYLDFKTSDSIVQVHSETIPLHKNYTLTFDVNKYPKEERKFLYIAAFNSRGKAYYTNTIKKDSTFYTSTRKLGKFTILKDTIQPNVMLHNFRNEQWVTHFPELKIRISDYESGIKSYRGEIDGEWILLEYEPKTGMLTYDLSDRKFETAKHQLKIVVTDNVGNSKTLKSTFYRKK